MEPTKPPHKRLKLNDGFHSKPDPAVVRLQRTAFLSSLSRPVSPPSSRQSGSAGGLETEFAVASSAREEPALVNNDVAVKWPPPVCQLKPDGLKAIKPTDLTQDANSRLLPSPFHLTRIHSLPDSANVDTVTIREILGSPLIKEAWIFNYCHDVDWTMEQFDSDIRDLVSVKIIHGFWRRENGSKIHIDDACRRYPKVDAIQAYLPDAYGTHHTKMIILLRHDDTAQVVIHTANMLPCDWFNTTQAAWCSPLLPLQSGGAESSPEPGKIGSGARFKHDLMRYLQAYGKGKMVPLVNALGKYDFAAVRGALIGSVPSKEPPATSAWGHVALKRAVKSIPFSGSEKISSSKPVPSSQPIVVCQVSSIATLKKDWITDIFFKALNPRGPARFSLVFPTPDEVRKSLDGYGCGGSIHCKAQTAAHLKQIDFLRPHLCHWASPPNSNVKDALRGTAAPHIKTYIRLSTSDSANPQHRVEWALLTSANLSVQAWGSAPKKPSKKEREEEGLREPFVHIQSYELGVLVWPELFADEGEDANMVPMFGEDTPGRTLGRKESTVTIGLRMPYDLPLTPYSPEETPWSPQSTYHERDTHGMTWPFQPMTED